MESVRDSIFLHFPGRTDFKKENCTGFRTVPYTTRILPFAMLCFVWQTDMPQCTGDVYTLMKLVLAGKPVDCMLMKLVVAGMPIEPTILLPLSLTLEIILIHST